MKIAAGKELNEKINFCKCDGNDLFVVNNKLLIIKHLTKSFTSICCGYEVL
jgi:hypothetical protein